MTGTEGGDSAASSVQRHEVSAAARRLRQGLYLGAFVWMAALPVDLLLCWQTPGARPRLVVSARLLGALLPLASLVSLRRFPRPQNRALHALDGVSFGSAVVALTLVSLGVDGPGGAYAVAVSLALAYRALCVVRPWQQGVWTMLLLLALYPATVGLWTLVDPVSPTYWAREHQWGRFLLNVVFIAAWAGIMLMSSHALWAVQRKVFENRSIGRYRLKRRIGEGAVGEVWRAYHQGLRMDVALKLLKRRGTRDGKALRRFEREVATTARLSHSNTVRVYDYGVSVDGIPYIAMELLHGGDLEKETRLRGPLPVTRACRLLRQIAGAVAEAHALGIVHRDLKPANVMITVDGRGQEQAKVLDFGLALGAEDRGDFRSTQLAGTPGFVAPEVLGGSEPTPASDVYALGALAVQMLTGEPPSTIGRGSGRDDSAATEIDGLRMSTALRLALQRCLETSPTDRFVDASALHQALELCSECASFVRLGETSMEPRADRG